MLSLVCFIDVLWSEMVAFMEIKNGNF